MVIDLTETLRAAERHSRDMRTAVTVFSNQAVRKIDAWTGAEFDDSREIGGFRITMKVECITESHKGEGLHDVPPVNDRAR